MTQQFIWFSCDADILTLKATWFFTTLLRMMRLFLSVSTEPKLSSSAGLKKRQQTHMVIPAQINKYHHVSQPFSAVAIYKYL